MDSRDNETTPRQHKNDIPCHLSLHNKNAMINEVSQLCNPTAGSSVTVPFRSLSSTKNDAAMHHSQTQRLKLKSLLLGIFQQECGRKLACTGKYWETIPLMAKLPREQPEGCHRGYQKLHAEGCQSSNAGLHQSCSCQESGYIKLR